MRTEAACESVHVWINASVVTRHVWMNASVVTCHVWMDASVVTCHVRYVYVHALNYCFSTVLCVLYVCVCG